MPMPRRRKFAGWELELHTRCSHFVKSVAPTVAPEVHDHMTQRIFMAMHRTLRHCVTLPSLEQPTGKFEDDPNLVRTRAAAE